MKKKLLFANPAQFGYHTDYVQYCKYLKKDYDITYICCDFGMKKIEEPGIQIIYIDRQGNFITNNINYIRNVLKCMKLEKYSLVFIHYFKCSSLIPLFGKKNQRFHLDIRTASVSHNKKIRIINDCIRRYESKLFKSQSIISVGLRDKLRIKRDAYLLPLGANILNVNRSCSKNIHLLYIGTFFNRRIEETIEGFYIFLKENPNAIIHYTIVGDGHQNERKILEKRIEQFMLQDYIDIKGYVPYFELYHFYEIANVGISYIPMTPYFEHQPPTKTFEYLMAGMPVIATQTYENKQVINSQNGVLIDDSPKSFAQGISEMYNSIDSYDENLIRKSVENYEWSKIIKNMKEAILP